MRSSFALGHFWCWQSYSSKRNRINSQSLVDVFSHCHHFGRQAAVRHFHDFRYEIGTNGLTVCIQRDHGRNDFAGSTQGCRFTLLALERQPTGPSLLYPVGHRSSWHRTQYQLRTCFDYIATVMQHRMGDSRLICTCQQLLHGGNNSTGKCCQLPGELSM